MKIGYFLSSEEWGPDDLVAQAVKAQGAGFEGLWISDHITPGTTSRATARLCGQQSGRSLKRRTA